MLSKNYLKIISRKTVIRRIRCWYFWEHLVQYLWKISFSKSNIILRHLQSATVVLPRKYCLVWLVTVLKFAYTQVKFTETDDRWNDWLRNRTQQNCYIYLCRRGMNCIGEWWRLYTMYSTQYIQAHMGIFGCHFTHCKLLEDVNMNMGRAGHGLTWRGTRWRGHDYMIITPWNR